jgi:CheY-like chemotaxis protein
MIAEDFDIVLLDVQMPVMGGLEAARLIRANEQAGGGHTPLLALTAHAMAEDRSRCLAAGMDDVLTKPLKSLELFATIERLTGAAARTVTDEHPGAAPSAPLCNIDIAALRAELGDDEIVANLCSLFMQDAPQLAGELDSALAAGDLKSLHRIAHRLKGSVGIFHAPQAVARLDALEAAAQAGDGLRARAECDAARGVLAALFAQLAEVQRKIAA